VATSTARADGALKQWCQQQLAARLFLYYKQLVARRRRSAAAAASMVVFNVVDPAAPVHLHHSHTKHLHLQQTVGLKHKNTTG